MFKEHSTVSVTRSRLLRWVSPSTKQSQNWKTRLDPGEAQAFAVAAIYDGTLVTDDGPARTLARDTGVSVTGSIGVLIRVVDNNHISEAEADQWLKQWIDETTTGLLPVTSQITVEVNQAFVLRSVSLVCLPI